MRTYIVRIYCCEKKDPRSFVGVLEEVGAEGKKAFTNIDDFWKILNCRVLAEEDEDTSPS